MQHTPSNAGHIPGTRCAYVALTYTKYTIYLKF